MKTPSSSNNNTKASPSPSPSPSSSHFPLAMSSSPSQSQSQSRSPLLDTSFKIKVIEPISADFGRLIITTGGKLIPPPITLLRNAKKGQSFAYFRYNTSDNNFIVEEIKIPQTKIMQACRKDGRLRLYFAHSFDDECFDEDEEEIDVTQVIEKEEGQNNI